MRGLLVRLVRVAELGDRDIFRHTLLQMQGSGFRMRV